MNKLILSGHLDHLPRCRPLLMTGDEGGPWRVPERESEFMEGYSIMYAAGLILDRPNRKTNLRLMLPDELNALRVHLRIRNAGAGLPRDKWNWFA